MTSLILLSLLCNLSILDSDTAAPLSIQIESTAPANGIAPANGTELVAMLLQGRIVLNRGERGGVTTRSDPASVNRSYSHSSRPLFGSQTSYAAKRSSSRYKPAPQLINSRDMARESVRRSAYGSRWGW